MRRILSIWLALLIVCIPIAHTMAADAEALPAYQETVYTIPEGYTLTESMGVSPEGDIYLLANDANAKPTLLRFTNKSDAPDILPLALSAMDNGKMQMAPDGDMLVQYMPARDDIVELIPHEAEAIDTASDAPVSEADNTPPSDEDGIPVEGDDTISEDVPAPTEGDAASEENAASEDISTEIDREAALATEYIHDDIAIHYAWISQEGETLQEFTITSEYYGAPFHALTGRRMGSPDIEASGITIYNEHGDIIQHIQSGDAYTTFAGENALYASNYEQIERWSLDTYERVSTQAVGIDYDAAVSAQPDGTLYFANAKGIMRIDPESTDYVPLMETLGTFLGDPTYEAQALATDGAERFVLLMALSWGSVNDYEDLLSSLTLVEYTRMEGVESRKPFVITALYEMDRLRKAASDFQRAHPELSVQLQVRMPRIWGENDNYEDFVRAMNTELLAGGGGDVMALDGLPMASLIKRGILMDIAHLIPEFSLLPGIEKGSIRPDGTVYAVPAEFYFSALFGRKDIIDSIQSLQDIAYLPIASDQRLLSARPPASLVYEFYPSCSDAFTDENGRVDFTSPNFTLFLETLYAISEQIDAVPEYGDMDYEGEMTDLYAGAVALYPSTVSGVWSLEQDYSITGGKDSAMIPFPSLEGPGNTYIPNLLMGIKAQSENKALAEEFLRMMFDADVQALNNGGALPCSASALDTLIEATIAENNKRAEYGGSSGSIRYPSGLTIELITPEESLYRAIRALCDTLSHPATDDSTLMEFIVEETQRMFDGTIGAQEAARAIEQRAFIYMNE